MKLSKSVLFKSFSFILTVAIFTMFAFLLVACNEVPDVPVTPDSDGFYYKQSEHIGRAKSISNFQNSQFSDYYSDGEAGFVIPGLNKGQNFILQGIAYCEEMNWALLCGYVKPDTSKSNSVIFVIDLSVKASFADGETYNGALIKELFLKNEDGSIFKGHAGGITVTKKNVWIANNKKLYRIPLDDIKNASKSGDIAFAGSVTVPVLSSYCSYNDGVLWVGEFEYAKDNYVTDSLHHSKDNASLTAWTVGYRLNEDGEAGYDGDTGFKSANSSGNTVPDFVLWHGQKVQGMTVAGNKVVLSTSYGRKNNSALYIYNNPIPSKSSAAVVIYGEEVPCYSLDTAVKKVVAPPMTEDLSVMRDGENYKIFVASESGAYYYHGNNAFNQSKYATDLVWIYNVTQD